MEQKIFDRLNVDFLNLFDSAYSFDTRCMFREAFCSVVSFLYYSGIFSYSEYRFLVDSAFAVYI